jgi:hypothetical protein
MPVLSYGVRQAIALAICVDAPCQFSAVLSFKTKFCLDKHTQQWSANLNVNRLGGADLTQARLSSQFRVHSPAAGIAAVD